jgi:hypothetical protein
MTRTEAEINAAIERMWKERAALAESILCAESQLEREKLIRRDWSIHARMEALRWAAGYPAMPLEDLLR